MPPAAVEVGDPLPADAGASPVAFIYRTMAEQHVGEYSFFRVYSGTIEQGMDLENAQTMSGERLGQLFAINGRERESVANMVAGDIGALVKLKNTHSNNTLRKKGQQTVVAPIVYPEPRYVTAIRPVKQGEEDRLAQGIHALCNEDPSLVFTQDPHLNQMLLGGQGEMHLTIVKYRLQNRFGVDIETYRPKISYRETIQSQARASYRHKKQSGGAGQFADISMLVEPLDREFKPPADITVRGVTELETAWGAKIEFIDGIVGGVIDMRRFSGSIQKGVLEAMQRGPIAGYPVGAVRIVVYDGGMHPVDSNDAAFKSAGRMCFREAFKQAKPVILEPICDVEILVPDSYTGDVMGDLKYPPVAYPGYRSRRGFAENQGARARGGTLSVFDIAAFDDAGTRDSCRNLLSVRSHAARHSGETEKRDGRHGRCIGCGAFARRNIDFERHRLSFLKPQSPSSIRSKMGFLVARERLELSTSGL